MDFNCTRTDSGGIELYIEVRKYIQRVYKCYICGVFAVRSVFRYCLCCSVTACKANFQRRVDVYGSGK